MKAIKQLNIYCLTLAVFFLPIHLNLNNILIVCFIGLSMLSLFVEHEESVLKRLKKNKWVLVIAAIPFLLNALGLTYTDEFEKGLDFTIRAIPFLFLPLIAILSPNIFNKNYKKFGYALTLGCLFVMLYSWSFSIIDIQSQNKPLKELFGPLYSHHNLIKALDLHAAYLSICIYTAIGFIILVYKNLKRTHQIIAIIVVIALSLFMFHLLSRNAIIYYLLASIVFLAYYRKWKILTLAFITVIILGTLAYNVKHNYLRDRIFNNLNFFEKETQFSKKDDRFDRLAASYEVFTQKPIIGYGTAAESKHRREVFKRNKDTIGYERNYNAHNQFFEYLSTYGIIGGLSYILFFAYLFYVCIKLRNGFFIYAVTGLFFACLTESIFERSQGVVYSSILIALLLSYSINKAKKVNENN